MPVSRAPQWIEVDVQRLTRNLQSFRAHLPSSVQLAPVVKSNAYGHGLAHAARAFAEGGAECFCVHSFSEACQLEDLGLERSILILGPLDSSELEAAIAHGFEITVYDPLRVAELESEAARQGRRARVHLKVETGTWRQGATGPEFLECLGVCKESTHIDLIGLHSHYANIEDTTDHSYAEAQSREFQEAAQQLEAHGLRPARMHMSCSAAAILFPSRFMDLARVGISAYGYWPSSPTRISARKEGRDELDLAPALTWKVRVAQVKRAPEGAYIGYGCEDKVQVDTRLAVLPVGYADGYDRGINGRGHVLLHGRRCPVRGRICMNLMMVDVSHLPQTAVGDEAVLLGCQGDEEISAETLAGWADTIHYEILARLSPAIPRIPV